MTAGTITAVMVIASITLTLGIGSGIVIRFVPGNFPYRNYIESASLGFITIGFGLLFIVVLYNEAYDVLLWLATLCTGIGFTIYVFYTKIPDTYTQRNKIWAVSMILMGLAIIMLYGMCFAEL